MSKTGQRKVPGNNENDLSYFVFCTTGIQWLEQIDCRCARNSYIIFIGVYGEVDELCVEVSRGDLLEVVVQNADADAGADVPDPYVSFPRYSSRMHP
jgi:hypothetical protein